MDYAKIDANTIEIQEIEMKEVTRTYDYDFLIKQRAEIVQRKEVEIAQRDSEIAVIDAILVECGKLGIVGKEVV